MNRLNDINARIKPVHSLGLTLAALFYGKAGTGKTTLAATFPVPMLLLDVNEKGTDSIADVPGIDVLSITQWDDFEQVFWLLKKGAYRTVVVDAVTQLQDYAIAKSNPDSKAGGMTVMTQRQWGIAAGLLKTWLVNYRDLIDDGINVVFIAHDKTREPEESTDGEVVPSIGPRVMPSVASTLSACVKIVGNTFIREEFVKDAGKKRREVSYCLRLGPHANYETKIRQPRTGFTPDFVTNPHYRDLVALMQGTFAQPETVVQPTVVRPTLKRKTV